MGGVVLAVQSDHFYNAHLQEFVKPSDLFVHAQDPFYSFWHSTVREKHEGVTLAGCVGLSGKEGLHKLRRIWDEILEFAIDSVHGEYSVFSNV
jgi:hypothetical protein